ncbi:MAG: type II toxin-antitoxin system VapC family toxin, partial [Alphaproteobacteria bacterium]|nr:type II toxin-antitoxin system VapC family toxin [Alphaproteobacteria bacterium]
MYLLDTVVLSELRKRDRHPGVVRWLQGRSAADIYLSVVTIGEIERGIVRQRGSDPAFAEALESWLDQTIPVYLDRILPINTRIAR